MYAQHYQLTSDPFRLTPDPDFSFTHQSYGKAWAYMQYALRQGEGFLVITGRPGSGKTTLVRSLLAELEKQRIASAVLVSTRFEAEDLVPMVAHAFGLKIDGSDKLAILRQLEEFLKRQARSGHPALLLIDEAQGLSSETLQELYRITNLYEGETPLLQVFLVGQDQLRGVLHAAGWGELKQRLIAACHLEPLGLEQTHAYIRHRLLRSGWRGNPQFSDEAVRLIHHFSEGLPRRINTMCSRLLLFGSVHNKRTLSGDDVRLVIDELREERLHVDDPDADEAVFASAETEAAAAAEASAEPAGLFDIRAPEPETETASPPERPASERPASERPASERPASERPASERPAQERPAQERPARRARTDVEAMAAAGLGDARSERRPRPAPEPFRATEPPPTRKPEPRIGPAANEDELYIPGPRRGDVFDEAAAGPHPAQMAPKRSRGGRVLLMLVVAVGLLVLFRNYLPIPVGDSPTQAQITPRSAPERAAEARNAAPEGAQSAPAPGGQTAETATAPSGLEGRPDEAVLGQAERVPEPGAADASSAAESQAAPEAAASPSPAADGTASARPETAPPATGDTTMPVPQTTAQQALPAPRQAGGDTGAGQIPTLLRQANAALEDYRLTVPEQYNAYDLFQQVLRLDPDNEAARAGMAEIVVRYTWLARSALERGEYRRVEQYTERGMRLDPDNEELHAIQRLLTIERESYGLRP